MPPCLASFYLFEELLFFSVCVYVCSWVNRCSSHVCRIQKRPEEGPDVLKATMLMLGTQVPSSERAVNPQNTEAEFQPQLHFIIIFLCVVTECLTDAWNFMAPAMLLLNSVGTLFCGVALSIHSLANLGGRNGQEDWGKGKQNRVLVSQVEKDSYVREDEAGSPAGFSL